MKQVSRADMECLQSASHQRERTAKAVQWTAIGGEAVGEGLLRSVVKKWHSMKKYPELVHETEEDYICTIWTGPNYYIGCFDKKSIDDYIAYAEECGVYVTFDQAVARTPVGDMHFMCKTEDYTEELLQEWINHFNQVEEEIKNE